VLVEIWSDVVCPWCYLGARRFDRALAAFDGRDEVEVVFRSFELDPSAPADRSEPLTEYLADRYGVETAEARAMQDRVSEVAAREGLAYRLDLARTARTFDAHRLTHLGRSVQRQAEVVETLMAAYFTEGARLAEPATLLSLGVRAGLAESDVTALLEGDAYAQAVRDDEALAASLGIRGVPFFVADRRLGLSGAQPFHGMARFLQEARTAPAR
jgi:predicted DsbA family dithiol-disulfide isomerase